MMILAESEIVEITGKCRWSAQAKELEHMGIPYRRRTDGKVIVFKEEITNAKAEKTRPRSPRMCL